MAVANNNTGITKDARFIAEDCEFVSTGDTAVFASGYMTLVINNSKITGKTGGVHIMMGDIAITNSEIMAGSEELTALKVPTTKEQLEVQGTNAADGAAVMIRADLYYDANLKTNKLVLDFTGTTFASSTGVAISFYKCNDVKGTLAGVTDKTTVMNQAEYVETILAGLNVTTKTFEYVDGAINEVTNA